MTMRSSVVDKAVTAAGLHARYAQPHRKYHTADHIAHMLASIDEMRPTSGQLESLHLATWFHDAIYAPGRNDNEQRSAFLASDTLEMIGASPQLAAEVARLILITQSHAPQSDDEPGCILSDADLNILAASPAIYADYARAIRQEYELVPDDLYKTARATVLRTFLDRSTIFTGPTSQQLWEDAARSNLTAEIRKLEAR
ncbi:MAG: metal-dependent phosphohydrolase [Candidatus Nanopelagicales bacterium]